MGIVIAFIIITAVYVGYHASQTSTPEVKGHSIDLDPQIDSFEVSQEIQLKTDQQYILLH
ncbi:MAG: hypothetical protein OEL69_07135 [Nitrosopumilus sp.]|nr:hypothetical protein [Nitrosopumilus sp.]